MDTTLDQKLYIHNYITLLSFYHHIPLLFLYYQKAYHNNQIPIFVLLQNSTIVWSRVLSLQKRIDPRRYILLQVPVKELIIVQMVYAILEDGEPGRVFLWRDVGDL